MERRDFLVGCGAAAALGTLGCSSGKDSATPETPPAAPAAQGAAPPPAPAPAGGAARMAPMFHVAFSGLGVFVVPKSGYDWVEVAFVDTTRQANKMIQPHVPTLRVPRESLVWHDKQPQPAAADDKNAFFSLAKVASIVPRQSTSASDLSRTVADLKSDKTVKKIDVGAASVANAQDCASASWDSVEWLLNIKRDLWAGAQLTPAWRKNPALLGRLLLEFGSLETGPVPADRGSRFTYTVPIGGKRVIKESVRYALDAPVLQVLFNNGESILIDRGSNRVDLTVQHVPAANMAGGRLDDISAIYDLLDNANAAPTPRPVPGARTTCTAAGATGTSSACPDPFMQEQ